MVNLKYKSKMFTDNIGKYQILDEIFPTIWCDFLNLQKTASNHRVLSDAIEFAKSKYFPKTNIKELLYAEEWNKTEIRSLVHIKEESSITLMVKIKYKE